MTTCDIRPKYDSSLDNKVGKSGKEQMPRSVAEEKPKASKRIVYSKEDLLQLRSAPCSLERPSTLDEQFFNTNGLWDPLKWSASPSSRGSTPAPDIKPPIKEEKKNDGLDDFVELMPHRRSFRLGCQVQQPAEPSKLDNSIKGMQAKKNVSAAAAACDGKRRLTGRAAGQRKALERVHMKDKDYENEKKGTKGNRQYSNRSARDDRRNDEEDLPEWVTGGPTSQSDTIELKGFDDSMQKKSKDKSKSKEAEEKPSSKQASTQEQSRTPKPMTLKEEAELLHAITSRGASPAGDGFDLNAFLADGGDYLPSDLFRDSDTDASMKSKFSQWFQLSQSSGGSGSRPGSETAGLDEQQWKGTADSPAAALSYFMPIQPAPAANSNPPQSLLDILHKGKLQQDKPVPVKEIKGRLNSEDVEARVMGKQKLREPLEEKDANVEQSSSAESSAYGKFVAAMKQAGQLPEKPAPVVVGLPDHLLPKPPPRKTSPSFDKLKHDRSPSPTHHSASMESDIHQFQKAVERLHQGPTVNNNSFQSPAPQPHFGPIVGNPMSVDSNGSSPMLEPPRSTAPISKKNSVPAAFMPTSVIRKFHQDIHSQKREGSKEKKEVPTPIGQAPSLAASFAKTGQNNFDEKPLETKPMRGFTSMGDRNTDPAKPLRDHLSEVSGVYNQAPIGDRSSRSLVPEQNVASPQPGSAFRHLDAPRQSQLPGSDGANMSAPLFTHTNQSRDDHFQQMIPRQNAAALQGQQILQLLQQPKERPNQFGGIGTPLPNMQNANRFNANNQQPFRYQVPPNFDNIAGLFPGHNYQQQQALKQHIGMNRLPHPAPGIPTDLLAQQAANQHFQQKLIQAAHVMQQKQQQQQQMERQLAIQRSLAASSRNRLPFNPQTPYNQNLLATNMQMLAQRMNLRPPNAAPPHRPLPTPMLSQQQIQQQAIAQQESLFRHAVPHPVIPQKPTPMPKDNPLSRFFDTEVLKAAGAQSTAVPGSKALTVEELEMLNR